jgi:hypothetical protein
VPNLEQAMAQHQMTLDHLTLDSQTASGRDQQQPQSPLADWRRDAEAVANHPSPELDPVHELQWYSSSTLNVHA